MLRITMAKLSGIIASGRLKLAAFRYWLTKKRRWNKYDPDGFLYCKDFCPRCKYFESCLLDLETLEASYD